MLNFRFQLLRPCRESEAIICLPIQLVLDMCIGVGHVET